MVILFLLLFLLGFDVADDTRPYLHWAVYSDKCSNESCVPQEPILYEVRELREAEKKFTADHPDLTIRGISRDYYLLCYRRQ